MTSELRVTTIANNAGSESVDTTYVVNGSLKHWLNATSAAVINDSFNNSSSTDNGTGNYTYGFTNNMNNSDWSPAGIVPQNSSFIEYVQSLTTADARLRIASDGGSGVDSANSLHIAGELA